MKFGTHKCTYYAKKFHRDKREEIILNNFKLCGEEILKLVGHKTFKYLREHKASVSSKTNMKPMLPNLEEEANEGKRVLLKYATRVAQVYTPRIRKLLYAKKLDFLSQTARPLMDIFCPMTPSLYR